MKIGELASATGIAASAIRFYEQSGLLPPAQRGSNGYRSYSSDAVDRLRFIQVAQSLGFTLDTMRSVFASAEGFSKDELQDELMLRLDTRLAEIDQVLATLRTQRNDLRGLRERMRTSWAAGECIDPSTLAPSGGACAASVPKAKRARGGSGVAPPAQECKASRAAPARRAVRR
jgi:MerR family copper efflux transcriptional regulator